MLLQAAEARRHFKRLVAFWAVFLLAGTSVIWVLGESEILRSLAGSRLVASHRSAIKILSDYAIMYPFYVLYVVLWWAGRRLHDGRLVTIASGYLIAQLVGAALLVRVLKMLIGRARPMAGTQPGSGTEWVGPTWDAAFHSFPSGHATDLITSAIFTAALLQRGWASLLLFTLAGFVGLTRVLLAKHYPTDVIGGALLGGMVSFAVLYWYVLPRLRDVTQPDRQ
jgi:membrane-associated phospholipid phosphatase